MHQYFSYLYDSENEEMQFSGSTSAYGWQSDSLNIFLKSKTSLLFPIMFENLTIEMSIKSFFIHLQNKNCFKTNPTFFSNNFAKSSPYFWLALHRTRLMWRFRKILWPSQNIWTLLKTFLRFSPFALNALWDTIKVRL